MLARSDCDVGSQSLEQSVQESIERRRRRSSASFAIAAGREVVAASEARAAEEDAVAAFEALAEWDGRIPVLGERIVCLFGEVFFPGYIRCVNLDNTVDVQFDDGDRRPAVPLNEIRSLNAGEQAKTNDALERSLSLELALAGISGKTGLAEAQDELNASDAPPVLTRQGNI